MNRLFVTGDTHGEIDGKNRFRSSSVFRQENPDLDRSDVVVVAGDFGFWWDRSPSDEYWRKWLTQLPFTLAFVDGNHENVPLLLESSEEVEKWGDYTNQLADNVFWLRRGRIYDLNGVRCFAFGGAMSRDKEGRKVGISWWPEEQPTYGEFLVGETNLGTDDYRVDLVVSHTFPSWAAEELRKDANLRADTRDGTEDMLQTFYEDVRFLAWFGGHFHRDKLLSDGKTRAVYKSVVDVKKLLMR